MLRGKMKNVDLFYSWLIIAFYPSGLYGGRQFYPGLTKPQYCGGQAAWVWRAHKKPFNYLCLG